MLAVAVAAVPSSSPPATRWRRKRSPKSIWWPGTSSSTAKAASRRRHCPEQRRADRNLRQRQDQHRQRRAAADPEDIEFEFDKHGSVDTTGLPKCSAAKLQATTVPAARKLCPGAIVGNGQGHAVVKFPEQGPIPANSPITSSTAEDRRRPHRLRPRLPHGPGADHDHRPGPDRKDPQRALRLPGQRRNPEDRRRLRHPDLRLDQGRSQMDLQGQEAQLRQRPLRRRSPAGDRGLRFKDGTG